MYNIHSKKVSNLSFVMIKSPFLTNKALYRLHFPEVAHAWSITFRNSNEWRLGFVNKSFMLIFTSMIMAITAMSQDATKLQYLALGDSYTIGESVDEQERWPVLLAKALSERGRAVDNPRIIATTGWRTDNLKNAIQIASLKPTYGLVSLLIGVNNQYQGRTVEQYEPEFKDLLLTAIQLAGGDKNRVFVVSIPDYGYTPYGKNKQEKISKELDQFNKANRAITESMGVRYFDITPISRKGLEDASLVANDGLHPSGKMYAQWVDLIIKGL